MSVLGSWFGLHPQYLLSLNKAAAAWVVPGVQMLA